MGYGKGRLDYFANDICHLYVNNQKSIVWLASHFNTCKDSINRILKMNNIEARVKVKPHNSSAHIPIEELKRMNDEGMTCKQIGNQAGVTTSSVSARFKRAGITPINWAKKFQFTKDEVLTLIEEGLNPEEIASHCGVGYEHLMKLSKQLGFNEEIKQIHKNKVSGRFSSIEQDVIDEYRFEQISQRALAKKFALNRATIKRILDRYDTEIRDRNTAAASRVLHEENDGSHQDSIRRALDGSGRFKDPRPCYFYVYGLARYPQLSKPGITFDISRRADIEYGEQHLILQFSSRLEAFFFERSISYHTRHLRVCPSDLDGWGGYSEIRNIKPKDLVTQANSLYSRFQSLGVWNYVLDQKLRMKSELLAEVKQRSLKPVTTKTSS